MVCLGKHHGVGSSKDPKAKPKEMEVSELLGATQAQTRVPKG